VVLPGLTDPKKPLAYEPVYRRLRKLAEDAGLGRVHRHLLRHRHTTLMASAADNLRAGMAVSGHKSVAAFMVYVHAEEKQAAAAAGEVSRRTAEPAASAAPIGDKVVEIEPRRAKRRRG
jgi:integrase